MSDDDLARLVELLVAARVEARVDALLTEERIEALAREKVEARVGLVSMPEAERFFGCPSREALLQFCREHRIKVVNFGRKKQFIRMAEIERALQDRERGVPDPRAIHGTRVAEFGETPRLQVVNGGAR